MHSINPTTRRYSGETQSLIISAGFVTAAVGFAFCGALYGFISPDALLLYGMLAGTVLALLLLAAAGGFAIASAVVHYRETRRHNLMVRHPDDCAACRFARANRGFGF